MIFHVKTYSSILLIKAVFLYSCLWIFRVNINLFFIYIAQNLVVLQAVLCGNLVWSKESQGSKSSTFLTTTSEMKASGRSEDQTFWNTWKWTENYILIISDPWRQTRKMSRKKMMEGTFCFWCCSSCNWRSWVLVKGPQELPHLEALPDVATDHELVCWRRYSCRTYALIIHIQNLQDCDSAMTCQNVRLHVVNVSYGQTWGGMEFFSTW